MGLKIALLIKNISYSVFVNLISMGISIFMIIIFPKFTSVEEYGVIQLYFYYYYYLGFLHFGWLDGIYLRYGGIQYNHLNKKVFSGQFYSLIILEAFLGTIIYFTAAYLECGFYGDIIKTLGILLPFYILSTFVNFLLQITDRIREYACFTLMERFLFLLLVILLCFFDCVDYIKILEIEIICKIFKFISSLFFIKDIVLSHCKNFADVYKEMLENITAGSKLLLANMANMLMIGIIRFAVSMEWDVSVFGKISLALSISNFVMVFVDAIGLVAFPTLRKINVEYLAELYIHIRIFLGVVLGGMLLLYFPVRESLSIWLPDYSESFQYLAILFPICLFESKMSLLVSTYLKNLRQEKVLLKINVISIIVSLALAFFSTKVYHSVNMSVYSIAVLFAFRCILAEYCLGNILKIDFVENVIKEVVLVMLFIGLNSLFENWNDFIMCFIIYAFYLLLMKEDIRILTSRLFRYIKGY